MDPLLISAASGMKARMESLDMLANNIANTGTAGFKADGEFYNLFEQELPMVQKQWTDFAQGTLTTTGNPLNLALSGSGLFVLNAPSGLVYTRNGDFRISKKNQLESREGYTLRNVLDKGQPITVDPTLPVDIGKDGVVQQGGQAIGQIEIAGIDQKALAVSKLGNSYFALTDKAAPATASPDTVVNQGQIEQSNVPVAESTVKLVSIMRQFEMMQKAISIGNEMNKSALQEVAKVV
jgi:flagellar basal body rod protein FlgG